MVWFREALRHMQVKCDAIFVNIIAIWTIFELLWKQDSLNLFCRNDTCIYIESDIICLFEFIGRQLAWNKKPDNAGFLNLIIIIK